MTVFEAVRRFEKITTDVIRSVGVEAVQKNADIVISDAIVANAEGLTFAGNKISAYKPFSDWEDSGEFHENLKFQSTSDIEFTSRGEGFQAIAEVFPYDDTIAPSAKILSNEAKSNIQKSFVEIIKTKI